MKSSRSAVHSKTHAIPALRFEDQRLTSFSGLVVFQALFSRLGLSPRLRECFRHLRRRPIFTAAEIFLQLVVHRILGYRELRDVRYYRDDPMVQRLLGLKRLPDVSTVSRALKDADAKGVENVRRCLKELVLERLQGLALFRVTLDFDGSVLSTQRHAEGTAVGFNKKKKGQRSYYPLFCTVPQLGQVFDVLHRPGNVHDSNGAREFILGSIDAIRSVLPHVIIEVRMDSAFFSDAIVEALESAGIEYTISVPFERFPELKERIEKRARWHRATAEVSCFEDGWRPRCWRRNRRFVFVRKAVAIQRKGPLQLDLFIPSRRGYEFKAIVTNKRVRMRAVIAFHEGRGAQEGIFGELKSQAALEYVPVRHLCGNQLYLLAGLLAHNLARELQMETTPALRSTTAQRATLWIFEQIATLRRNLLQRAGRLTRPQGALTLTMSANEAVRAQILRIFEALQIAA